MARTVPVAIVLLTVLALSGPLAADSTVVRWNAVGAQDYGYRFVRNACCEQPACTDSGSSGNVGCTSGPCSGYAVILHEPTALVDLYMTGISSYCIRGDYCPGSDGEARMKRTSPDTLSVEYRLTGEDGFFLPHLNVAVFRYAGDPAAFDGVEATNVYDLVAMGIIEQEDILFAQAVSGETGWIPNTVDVSGIPAEEVALFAAGTGLLPPGCPSHDPPGVPAAGHWGLAALALALGAAVARRVRRARAGFGPPGATPRSGPDAPGSNRWR